MFSFLILFNIQQYFLKKNRVFDNEENYDVKIILENNF